MQRSPKTIPKSLRLPSIMLPARRTPGGHRLTQPRPGRAHNPVRRDKTQYDQPLRHHTWIRRQSSQRYTRIRVFLFLFHAAALTHSHSHSHSDTSLHSTTFSPCLPLPFSDSAFPSFSFRRNHLIRFDGRNQPAEQGRARQEGEYQWYSFQRSSKAKSPARRTYRRTGL